ncbi:preprotein translocase subunit SecG [Govanella unica]|uniref:Protein-export membrane protein SecG n=1 Tax=Govanella unica TaxID=2975056 RepID=A0A9X3TXW0_9PROT|nr:preprotein translocase subunit SecG [Govania unica]MDA5193796.1 preprotein translocase subunit SecG [Govania unica]
MQTVLLVIHLIVALALVCTVLLQRSEGGALGIGGGPGGLMTARGAANLLTRTTAILAGCFFLTSLALSIIAGHSERGGSIMDRTKPAVSGTAPAAPASPPVPVNPEVPISE